MNVGDYVTIKTGEYTFTGTLAGFDYSDEDGVLVRIDRSSEAVVTFEAYLHQIDSISVIPAYSYKPTLRPSLLGIPR